ncbi:uncharacterized protein PG986_001559 [Apiospora aurea]|uniref:Uncharacterized protein n=1 Tax=Apiospora aurea TaxID=335848 RepID=A0ABR1QX55_9PEZI
MTNDDRNQEKKAQKAEIDQASISGFGRANDWVMDEPGGLGNTGQHWATLGDDWADAKGSKGSKGSDDWTH